jgi:hypothetical protein
MVGFIPAAFPGAAPARDPATAVTIMSAAASARTKLTKAL